MTSEPKKVGRRTFLNYAIAVVATGVIVGAAIYYGVPKGVVEKTVTSTVTVSGTTTTVEKTVTTTITGTPITSPTTTITTATPFPTITGIKPVTIRYMTHRYPYQCPDAYKRTAELIKNKTGLDTEYIGVPYAQHEQKLGTVISTPDAPDIDDTFYPLVLPYIIPLDEYFEKYKVPVDDIVGQKNYPCVWPKGIGGDDHYYLLGQWTGGRPCINYRRDVFKERGIEDPLEVRQKTGKYPAYKFFDEWYEIIKKCTFERSDGTKVYGYAMPTAPSDGPSRWAGEYLPWHYAFGGGIIVPEEPGKIVCGKEPYLSRNVKIAEFFRTLVKEGVTPLGVEKPTYLDILGNKGTVAQAKEGSWSFAQWKKEQYPNIATYPAPYYGPGFKYLKEIGTSGLWISKNCPHKEEAFIYIYYLCLDPEIALEYTRLTLNLTALKTIDLSPLFKEIPGLDAYDYVNKVLPTEGLNYTDAGTFLTNNIKNKPFVERIAEWKQAWFETFQKVLLSNENIQDLYIQLQDKLEKMFSL